MLVFITLNTSLQKVLSVDRTDNDEDYLYLFLYDADGKKKQLKNIQKNIEKNNGINYLVFNSTDKNKEALKNYKKLWEETKRQISINRW